MENMTMNFTYLNFKKAYFGLRNILGLKRKISKAKRPCPHGTLWRKSAEQKHVALNIYPFLSSYWAVMICRQARHKKMEEVTTLHDIQIWPWGYLHKDKLQLLNSSSPVTKRKDQIKYTYK